VPSLPHNLLVEIFRETPQLVAEVLRSIVGLEFPDGVELVDASETLIEMQSPEYRVDLVFRIRGPGSEDTLAGLIVEIQLAKKDRKRFTWPMYQHAYRARLERPVELIVVALDDAVARWCAEPVVIDPKGRLTWSPLVVGPSAVPWVVDVEQARANPELAVFSLLAHRNESGAESVGRAVLAICSDLDDDRSALYADLVLAFLNEAARAILEAEMRIENYEFQSDLAKRRFADGRREGEAAGEARGLRKSIAMVLEARGMPVSDEQRERLEACTDLDTLAHWLQRAAKVDQADDVFEG